MGSPHLRDTHGRYGRAFRETGAQAAYVTVEGPGIYALYYRGDFPEYQPLAEGTDPIYVGKAIPPGARKGTGDVDVRATALRRRLREHAKSIDAVSNLELKEFSFRALAIVPVWIGFAEQALIKRYEPVWNACLEGFGKHDQGKNRVGTLRSWWDTLHPERPWAQVAFRSGRGKTGRTEPEARQLVQDHFMERSRQ